MSSNNYPALSYWEREVWFKQVDVLIIGAGIVGLNAALQLKVQDPSLKVLVVERGSLPAGASTRNAGFACFGSMTELLSDEEEIGETAMIDLVARRYEGLIKLREKLGDRFIEYQALGGYEIFRSEERAIRERCQSGLSRYNALLKSITGYEESFIDHSAYIDQQGLHEIEHMIWNRAEGQVHTGRMMERLLYLVQQEGVKVISGLEVRAMEDFVDEVRIETQQGWEISAKRLIIATNGFSRRLLPELDIQPARNQVLITKPVQNLSLKGCFHYNQGYYYFRNINGRVLLGGGRHLDKEAETTDTFGKHPKISKALLQLLHTVILPDQNVEIDQWWTGIMGVGPVKKPIIEKVSPRVCVAVRLGGMGVAIGTWVGEQVAELVLNTTQLNN